MIGITHREKKLLFFSFIFDLYKKYIYLYKTKQKKKKQKTTALFRLYLSRRLL